MKKIITMLTTLCMVVALAVPAFALEYEIDGPGCEYGEDTSIEVVYTNEPDMNMDVSKNAALVPPAFGSASAYTLNTGYPLTPNLAPGTMPSNGAMVNGSSANVVPPAISGGATSGNTSNTSSYTGAGFTEVTSSLKYSDGSLGALTIPAIGVNTKIYEGTSTASMAKGAAHFSDTSIWDPPLGGHAHRGIACVGTVLRDDPQCLRAFFQNVYVYRYRSNPAFLFCGGTQPERGQELPQKLCRRLSGGRGHRTCLHHFLHIRGISARGIHRRGGIHGVELHRGAGIQYAHPRWEREDG